MELYRFIVINAFYDYNDAFELKVSSFWRILQSLANFQLFIRLNIAFRTSDARRSDQSYRQILNIGNMGVVEQEITQAFVATYLFLDLGRQLTSGVPARVNAKSWK